MPSIDLAPEPEDPIEPIEIKHCVDEGDDAQTGESIYYYNYLVYRFAHPRGEVGARAYLDTSAEVAIYLPHGVGLDDPVVRDVLTYLRRRFARVLRLGKNGYEEVPEQ